MDVVILQPPPEPDWWDDWPWGEPRPADFVSAIRGEHALYYVRTFRADGACLENAEFMGGGAVAAADERLEAAKGDPAVAGIWFLRHDRGRVGLQLVAELKRDPARGWRHRVVRDDPDPRPGPVAPAPGGG